MIVFACPSCGNELTAQTADAGKYVECGRCRKQATVPTQTPFDTDSAPTQRHDDVSPPPKAKMSVPATVPEGPEKPAGDGALPKIKGYEILSVLGRGGMGIVYKARQIGLNRVVALKMIIAGGYADAVDRRRFLTEAETVARLHHGNIVQIHQIGEHDGLPYFSLEFCEGGSLEQKLNGAPLPTDDAAQLVRSLARAMQAAHEANVVHRDLKPANILLAAGHQDAPLGETPSAAGKNRAIKSSAESFLHDVIPKIADFGLAKKLDSNVAHTASGAVLGTPSYMAPEQAAGKRDVGPAADIYALGVILYECLTGRPPLRAATPLDTVLLVVNQKPVPPADLNPKVDRDLDTICLKCLQKDPKQRYASAQDLADDLQRYLEGRPIAARPVSNVIKLWRLCRRHKGTSVSLTLMLLSLLGLFAMFITYNYQLGVELEQKQRITDRLGSELDQKRKMTHQLRMTLTTQLAERIDDDLTQIALIPQTMAGTLAVRDDWTHEQMNRWLSEMLDKDERVFGTCVAFEPGQFEAGRKDYSNYCYGDMGHRTWTPINYDYRAMPWYALPRMKRHGLWTEPFFDEGGGNIFMVTYAAPIWRKRLFLGIAIAERFVGVATADLSINYFGQLRKWLDQLDLGRTGYSFVLSPSGLVITHPSAEFRPDRKTKTFNNIANIKIFNDGPAMRNLTQRLLRHESGSESLVDPYTGKPSVYYFAPVPSAQWTLVVVVEE